MNGYSVCPTCSRRLPPAPDLPPPLGLSGFGAAFAYEGEARRLITSLKFHNRRGALSWMAVEVARPFAARRLNGATWDCATWIPSSHSGRLERGFDTGKLLARRVAGLLGIPAYALLVRTGNERQTGRSAAQRQSGPRLEARPRAFRMQRVLLIDDVCTTGASLATATELLRRCGVVQVDSAVIARTPVVAKPQARNVV